MIDLKPENVMVVADPEVPGGQRAIVVDFGVAKLGAEHKHPETVEQQTDVRIPIGTAKYMSPEQAGLDKTVSDRADVYSLGVMIYELLSGAPPFSASTHALLLDMHRFSVPIPLDRLVPRLDRRLVELGNRMLAKKPAERPSMDEVANTLQRILTGGQSGAKAKARPVEPMRDAATPSPLPIPSQPKTRRRTEPIEQLGEKSLLEAASKLFHDSETVPVSKLDPEEPTTELAADAIPDVLADGSPSIDELAEPTAELVPEGAEEVTAVSASNSQTLPSVKHSDAAVASRRRRRQRRRRQRIEEVAAILIAVAALIWAVAAILR